MFTIRIQKACWKKKKTPIPETENSWQLLKNKKHAYFFPNFPQGKIKAFFSDRFYNLGFYNTTPEKLKTNRHNFLKNLGINYEDLVCAKQPHSNKIVLVTQRNKGKGAINFRNAFSGVDGFLTKEKNLPLAVFTADCLSIFLFDAKNSAVGLVHAGWKGTHKKIAEKAVLKMEKCFKTKPQDLIVGFGPAIRSCCYEVKNDFKKFFPSGLIRRGEKLCIDIIAANTKQLIKQGVKRGNIFDCKICTSCQNKNFFSYRREGEAAGRMMSLIMLK